MDIYEGDTGPCSRESIGNFLDEGLGTSLDGTDEISSSIHSTLGRNDSGVFDEMTTTSPPANQGTNSISVDSSSGVKSVNINNNNNNNNNSGGGGGVVVVGAGVGGTTNNNNNSTHHHKKKNSSPNRHSGPQRCAVCGKIFSNASALTKHKLTHSDERKHACSVCAKAFKRQDHLNGHMLTHRRQKPFECRAKGCGKSYCDGRSLRRHIESRHGAEALATLTIQATPSSSSSSSSSSSLSSPSKNNSTVVSTLANTNSSDVQLMGGNGVVSSHIMVVGSSTATGVEESNGLVMETDMVNCCQLPSNNQQPEHILSLDSNLLEHSYGTPMDIQVTLPPPPPTAQDEKHPQSATITTTTKMMDPIHVAKAGGGMLGLTFATGGVRTTTSNNNNTELCNTTVGDTILRNSSSMGCTPSTMTTTTATATVSGSTGVAVATVPVTIRTSHSQLHQLLTQRAANAGLGIANLANASLVHINPGSLNTSCHPQQQHHHHLHHQHDSYASNWTTDHREIQMTKMSDDRTNDGGSVGIGVSMPSNANVNSAHTTTTTLLLTTGGGGGGVGGSGKSPSIPISASSSDMTLTPSSSSSTTTASAASSSSTTATAGATTASPTLLKEQLELIHQIIQQAQEESNLTAAVAAAAAAANSNTSKSALGKSKGSSKKTKNNQSQGNCAGGGGGNGIVIKIEAGGEGGGETIKSSSSSPIIGTDDKPVECTICCRRFKNTPALNGHMRLHGGYFKKDADGKRKDVISSSKESSTPLQTASVSVRALIEEKIIQKRNTQSQSQGIEKTLIAPLHQNQVTPADSQIVFGDGQVVPGSVETHEALNVGLSLSDSLSTSAATLSSTFNLSTTSQPSQNLRFVYGDDNTDYLLMDEEVLNKCYVSDFLCQVSSICPDSFLNAIDESILNNSGNDQFPPEWNWATTGLGGSDSSDQHFVKLQSSLSSTGSPVTPLPPLDAALYASPTPQSPSVNSQDSPSFMYPTPPASLESHNALQSPLFPFPAPAQQTTTTTSSQQMTVVLPFDTTSNSYSTGPLDPNSLVPGGPISSSSSSSSSDLLDGSTILNPVNVNLNLSNFSSLNTTTIPGICSVILAADGSVNVVDDGSGATTPTTTTTLACSAGGGEQLQNVRQFVSVQRESSSNTMTTTTTPTTNTSGGTTITSELNILTPSNSPSLANAGVGVGGSMEDPLLQSVKELKVNEPSRMDCSGGAVSAAAGGSGSGSGVFLNPNSVPSSPCLKSSSAKRKQVRNTFASNLRPLTNSPYKSSQSQFTPYPILSPVRSAPGLYWTFSTKLSHVDDSKKEVPKINIGSNFQATLPDCTFKKRKQQKKINNNNNNIMEMEGAEEYLEDEEEEKERESRLWSPDCLEFCSPQDVDNYLELACCSAIPGGGRNKEYALHILNSCNGDINTAIFLLMNPSPSLPNNLKKYNYQETKKWCREEINIFQEALLRYGKDFVQVAKEIEGKSTEECVIFYQLWKKVCSVEYEKIRTVWKARDASFTLELLKNVPPPMSINSHSSASASSLHNNKNNNNNCSTLSASSSEPTNNVPTMMAVTIPLGDITSGHTFHLSREEYPCKVCSKIFSKVKSRSAHMKSHRSPDTSDNNNSNSKSTGSKKLKAANKANSNKASGGSSSSLIAPELSNCSWPPPPPPPSSSSSPSSSSLASSSSTLVGQQQSEQVITSSPLRSSLGSVIKQENLLTVTTDSADPTGTGDFKMIPNSGHGCDSNNPSTTPTTLSSSSTQLPVTTRIASSLPSANSTNSDMVTLTSEKNSGTKDT